MSVPLGISGRRHLAGGALVSLVAQVSTVGLLAGTSVVLGRAIGPDGLGTYSLCYNLLLLLGTFFGVGLPAGLTYYMSQGGWRRADALRSSIIAAAILGTAGAVVTLGAWFLLRGSAFRGISGSMIIAVAALLPFLLIVYFCRALVLSEERYELWGFIQIGQAIAGATGAVTFGLLLGVEGAVLGLVGGNAVAAIVAVLVVARGAGPPSAGKPSQIWAARRFGLPAWGGDILQLLNYRLDLFLLNAYATPSDVGYYSVAVSLTWLGWLAPNALASVAYARTARLSGESHRLKDSSVDAMGIAALRHSVALIPVTAAALALLAIFGVPLLFGSEFGDAVVLAFILLPGVVIVGVGKVGSAIVTGRGYPRYALMTAVITVPLTVALYLILIPVLQAPGAALASAISYLATTGLILLFLRRISGLRLTSTLPVPREIIADYTAAVTRVRSYIHQWRKPSQQDVR